MIRIRRLFAAFAALVLALGVAVPAWADDAGSITVADAGTYTYEAYKIFDIVTSDSSVTYSISTSNEWFSILYTNGVSQFEGLTFTQDSTDSTKYVVTEGTGYDAAKFAAFLKGKVADTSVTTPKASATVAASDDTASLTGLAAGYYLVLAKDGNTYGEEGMLTTVLDVSPGQNVTIQNKNDMPFDKEITSKKHAGDSTSEDVKDKESDVQIGDTVNFTITGQLPAGLDGYSSYTYQVKDAMTTGLIFDTTSLIVKVGDTTVTPTTIEANTTYGLSGDQVRYNGANVSNNGFELSIDLMNFKNLAEGASRTITITYSATVNEKARNVVSENDATLTYGNDPDKFTTKDTETKVYTSRIVIDKFENGSRETKLAGAKFRLYKGSGEFKQYYKATTDTSGNVTQVEWISTENEATVFTTASDGSATFDGLEDDTYYLEETEAPTGYAKLSDPVTVTIDGSSSTTVGLDAEQVSYTLTNTASIANTPDTLIPSTGGMGTTVFYVASAAVLAVIVVRVVRHRREA